MKKTGNIYFTGILLGLLILSLGAVFVIFQMIEANKVSTFFIETKKIPLLKHHLHDPAEESIFNAGHAVYANSEPFIVPEDIWIKGFDTKTVNVDSPIIHHLYLGRTDKRDSLCRNYKTQAVYVTSEVNTVPQIFPLNYGMFILKGTPLKIFSMLHNPSPPLGPGKDYKDVSVKIIVYAEKASIFKKHKPIEYQRLHLSDKPCAGLERGEIFEVPPETQNFVKKDSVIKRINTASHTFSESGVLVGIGGHMHPFEGGQSVDIYHNKNLLHSFTSTEYDHGFWKSWDTPIYPYYERVSAHDTLSIEARYTNPNKTPIRGAMGMAVFYFAKD